MRALTVVPEQQGSAAVTDVEEPGPEQGDLLVDGLALGVCGTDREIIAGDYGEAPPGHERLVLGHESLGVVKDAPEGSGFARGDLVVGIVRRPDPVPCDACARGEFDMCRNGRFKERGIKQLDGYGSERWRVESDYCVKLDPGLRSVGMLMEPTTVVAKAIEQAQRIGEAMRFKPRRLLVTGAGPIGLLGAMLGVQRGLEVHVLDHVSDGPKPALVEDLGATYHSGSIAEVVGKTGADAILEATGVGQLVFDAMDHLAAGGVVCLTGLSPAGGTLSVDAGSINRDLVLQNNVVLGSVNANAVGDLALLARRTRGRHLLLRKHAVRVARIAARFERDKLAVGAEAEDVGALDVYPLEGHRGEDDDLGAIGDEVARHGGELFARQLPPQPGHLAFALVGPAQRVVAGRGPDDLLVHIGHRALGVPVLEGLVGGFSRSLVLLSTHSFPSVDLEIGSSEHMPTAQSAL